MRPLYKSLLALPHCNPLLPCSSPALTTIVFSSFSPILSQQWPSILMALCFIKPPAPLPRHAVRLPSLLHSLCNSGISIGKRDLFAIKRHDYPPLKDSLCCAPSRPVFFDLGAAAATVILIKPGFQPRFFTVNIPQLYERLKEYKPRVSATCL